MNKRIISLSCLLIIELINVIPLYSNNYLSNTLFNKTTYFNKTKVSLSINPPIASLSNSNLVGTIEPSLSTSFALTVNCEVNENVSVIGGMDGLVSIEVFDGDAPYNVELLNTDIDPILSLNGKANFPNLSIGTYTVEVVDANGEMGSCTFTIRNPCIFSVNSTLTEISCSDAKDGAITLDFTNGIPPYTINWSNTSYNGLERITKLAPGNYQVTVSDTIGCSDTAAITLTAPAPLSANITQDSFTICAGTSMPIGLTENHDKYNWSTTETASSIIVNEKGNYSVTVTDEKGCTASDTAYVEIIKQDTIRETFFICDSSRTGDFFLERRNSNGCMDIVFRTLALAMVDTFFKEETTCNADEVGVFTTIIADNTGCNALFIRKINLLKSDTTYLTETSCNPQDTGMIQLAFVNQLGCDSIVEIRTTLEISDDCLIDFNILTDTLCRNETEGMIQLEATFGNPPFSYFLIDSQTNDTIENGIIEELNKTVLINNVLDRNYSVKFTNPQTFSGKEQVVFFPKYPAIDIQAQLSDYAGFSISCEGAKDGSIQLLTNDNQRPYNYVWESGQTTPFLQNLAEGVYSVTVSDDFNCQRVATFNLFSPSALSIDYQEIHPTCEGENLGQFVINDLLNINGDAAYSLDGIIFQPIDTLPFVITDLKIGNHQLFIQDENDCQVSVFFEIDAPVEKRLSLEGETILELGDSLILVPVANFDITQFEWTSTVPSLCKDCSEISIIPVQDGKYNLTAYDVNGCSASTSATIKLRKEKQVFIPNIFSPNGDGINDVYQIFTGKSVARLNQFRVFDVKGRLMYQANDRLPNDPAIGWDGRFNGQKMLPAVFVVLIEVELLDGTMQQYSETITLVE